MFIAILKINMEGRRSKQIYPNDEIGDMAPGTVIVGILYMQI